MSAQGLAWLVFGLCIKASLGVHPIWSATIPFNGAQGKAAAVRLSSVEPGPKLRKHVVAKLLRRQPT